MRKLAEELGVGVMSLYYYVPNKDELIEGWSSSSSPRSSCRRTTSTGRPRCANGRSRPGGAQPPPLGGRADGVAPLPGPASFRVHNAVLGCLREAGFSIELTIQAYSVLDAYIYGFALQEKTLPFEDAAGAAAVATEQVREFAADAEEEQSPALADEFPYLAEVVAGHVDKVGYDFAERSTTASISSSTRSRNGATRLALLRGVANSLELEPMGVEPVGRKAVLTVLRKLPVARRG